MARTATKTTKPRAKPAAKAPPAPAEPPVSTFAVGDHIAHASFGAGDVTAVNGLTLTIAFEKVGTKQVLDGFVTRHR